jgi:hypothetical protein|tara:strand:- start:388 stop:876 length:489 start_codon:yes stop_codon:yes gene_type:complete
MKIIDNFLSDEEFKPIAETFLGEEFPWFYNDAISERGDDRFQFIHGLYKDCTFVSNFAPLMFPILNKLNMFMLKRIKANLITRTEKQLKSVPHIDFKNIKTAIFYVNTNNGYTQFDNKTVPSVANRIVIFDSNLKHSSVSQTNTKQRVVINFNYVTQEDNEN